MAENNDTEPIDMDPLLDENEDDEVLRVRYIGSADKRVLTRGDLSGHPGDVSDQVTWTRGGAVNYDLLVELAGSDEQLRDVLKSQRHEFDLVGPGADEFWSDDEGGVEFEVSGPA